MTLPYAAILILAAGQSSRMGELDKMLEPVEGQPLIRRQCHMALATGLPVWVTLPPDRPLRWTAVATLPVTKVLVDAARQGLAKSIIAGNAAIPDAYNLLLCLADLPDVTTDDMLQLLAAATAAPSKIIRATTEAGRPGHPVYFPSLLRSGLADLSGDTGAGAFLRQQVANTVMLALPGNRALTDLDTPEDWANWRARRMPRPPSSRL